MTTHDGRDNASLGDIWATPHKADSPATERENSTQDDHGESTQLDDTASREATGDVASRSESEPAADEPCVHAREVDVLTVYNRFLQEGRWFGAIELERDAMMKLARKQFPDKKARQQWVYGELDRMYPPQLLYANVPLSQSRPYSDRQPEITPAAADGSIQGLGSIPEGWPDLPSNASLAAELGWVQANRLRVVTEKLGKATIVHLEQAISPAPSWSALGWLETSIRSYAKFVDVAAKVTGGDEGETGVMRRERMAIDEVRVLLGEMMGFEVCPTCGKPK